MDISTAQTSEPSEELGVLLVPPLEAGRILRVGKTTVFKLIKNGELKSRKIGKSRRISLDSIRELAAKGTR